MKFQTRFKNVIFLGVIVIFLPMVWLSINSGTSRTPDGVQLESLLEGRVAELRDRLQHAETQNREREGDMQTLRRQVDILSRTHQHANSSSGEGLVISREAEALLANITLGSNDIHPPGLFNYLPHLVGKPEGLSASYKISRNRKGVSVVIGIPHVKRDKENYLYRTLTSLLAGLSSEERADCLIIVFVAEPWDIEYSKAVGAEIQSKFSDDVKEGLIEVISPSPFYYPDMNALKETFGDSLERVRWRTKQNLDFTFLMMYSTSRGTYYMQLEDDIETKPGYLTAVKNFALSQKSQEWILLEFSHLGFIGKLFKCNDLALIVEFFLMFHRDKPIDWLLDHLLYVKVCNPEKDNKHCQRSVSELRIRYKPSLFQHVGVHSSLKGKVQKLKDRDFGKQSLHQAHINPPAEVSTTLKTYQRFSVDRAYLGETFFWGTLPKADDTVVIKFSPPVVIDKYLFRSGNAEHPGDKFYNTTVEIFPARRGVGQLGGAWVSGAGSTTSDGFLLVGNFSHVTGLAEGPVGAEFGDVEVIRLRVHSDSEAWVILSEILIKVYKATAT